MLVLIVGGFMIGWFMRWYFKRWVRKVAREEVNAAITNAVSLKLK